MQSRDAAPSAPAIVYICANARECRLGGSNAAEPRISFRQQRIKPRWDHILGDLGWIRGLEALNPGSDRRPITALGVQKRAYFRSRNQNVGSRLPWGQKRKNCLSSPGVVQADQSFCLE